MKKLIYALLAVLFVLVAAVLLLPSVIDWNAYKDQLARQVEQATGRTVTVNGPVSLAMLPTPALSAQQVTFANLDGGRAQPMARIADLRVRIALAPLLQGRVEVERLVLVEPRLLLERTAGGRANWRFRPAGDAAQGNGAGGLPGQVSLQDVRVVDGTLRYLDAAAGIDRQVTGVDAQLSADSLSGPFRAEGSLTSAGVPLELDGQLGRLDGDGPAPYSLSVQLAGTDTRANLGGALTTGPKARLQGDLELRGGDLSAALARITGRPAASYPVQLAQTFSGESTLDLEDGVLKAQDLALRLGDTGANGRLRVTLPAANGGTDRRADRTTLATDLTIQRIDLDRLLAIERDGPSAADAAGGTGGSGDDAGGFALPKDLRAELNLNVGAILYRDRVIRQGRANAVLDDGTVTLNQAMALLPGSSDLAMFGTLAARDGRPVFDGRLESASDNLRGVLDWLGVAVDGVAEDRLRRMELLADVEARPGRVTLTGIDLDVDTAHLEGGVAIALRRRPGFGIGLTADKLNLDAYLPAGGPGGDDGGGQATDGASGPPLGWLGGFDANLDLRAGQLTFAGTTAEDVTLDATLHNQALTIREAAAGNLAGAAVRVDGELTELIGLDPQFDLDLDVDIRDLPRFTGALGLGDDVSAGLGPLALVGTARGGLADAKVDGTLRALGGTATFQGTVEPLAAPAAFDLVLAVQHDSLRALAEQAPGLARPPGDAGPLDLTARLSGTARRFGTDNLKGRIGPVDLSGPAALDLTGARPKLTASLETGAWPLGIFAAASGRDAAAGPAGDRSGSDGSGGGGSAGGEAGGEAKDNGTGGAGSGARWSAQPLPLGALTAVDLDLSLTSEAIVLADGSRFEDADLAATLSDGVLDLENLTGELFDGEVRAHGALDVRDGPAASLAIDADQVSSAPLLKRAFGLAALDGPLDLQAELSAEGANPNALIASLRGAGSLNGRVTVDPQLFLGPQASELRGREETGDETGGETGGGRLGRQLSDMLGEALGAEVKIGGLTQAFDFVGTAFTQQRAKLTGSFSVTDGVVTTSDLTLDGLEGRAETRGEVDLPNWRLDTTTELFRAKDAPDRPFLVTRQSGRLGALDVAITGGAFQQGLSRDKLERELPDGAPAAANDAEAGDAEAGDAPSPKRAEEIIRGVLDQLQTDR